MHYIFNNILSESIWKRKTQTCKVLS